MTPNRRNSASANAAPSRPRLRIWLTLLLLSLGLLPSDAEAARGRPFIGRGTVLTDTGTLLRGPRVSLDRDVPAPTFTELQDIKNRGGNALHVYAEREGDPSDSGAGPTPGYKLAELTGLVNLTRTLDMYLVITVGNAPGSFDHDFAVDFWDLYAAEFGDEPHVIFELQNEPYARFCPIHQSAPSPLAVLEMERDAYCKVREHAPDSMVLLFSYAMFTLASGVLQDIDDLQPMVVDPVDGCGQSIDWSRTAIAFHGYHFPTLRGTMETVTGAGYGIVQTEFGPYCDLEIHCGTGECFGCDDPATCDVGALAVEHLELHEELGISWFTFMRVDRYLDDASFRDPVDAADLLWLPDFGNWPASSDPPIGATVSFFSEPGSSYVSADRTVDPTNPPLRANENEPGLDERFDVLAHGPGAVALKARANDKYVKPAGDLHLTASSSTPIGFEWLDRPDGRVTLRLTQGLFVAADYNLGVEAPLVANRIKGGGPWEAFVVAEECPVPLHDMDYCALCGPCQVGESDCDTDAECANGLVCAHDVGANYGLPPTQDVCELPSNNPPVAFPDPLATPFETDLVLLNTTLMANDEDPDPGDVVVWTSPQTLIADHGDITQTVLGSGEVELRYTPPAGFSGTDRFSYLIEDNHGLPADQPGEVTIQVLAPANSPPEPMSDALLVPYLAIGIQVPSAYFLANDDDPDGDVLWISDLGSATHGGLKLDRGDVIFSPDASFWSAGADAFTYDVIDGSLTAQGLVNVAAEPVCDTYLGDDFETGDLAAWSQVVASSGGSVTADTAAAAEGVFGLAIDPASGTGFFYVEDDSPVNERHFRARLRFNTDDFTLPTGAEHSLLSGLVPGSNAFSLRLANSGGGPQLRLAVSRDNDSQALSAKVDIAADAWHRLFVDWWAATAPGSSDGGARLWLNGRLVAEILGVDNDGRAVDRVRLGAAAGLDAGSSGRYFFDAYASCDGGPGSRSSN